MGRLLILAACLFLAACDVKQRSIPHFKDYDGVQRIAAELSPWEDGSPDRSYDGLTPGDENSDRQLFRRWMAGYSTHEIYSQHSYDYVPYEVPATVREAIEQQRQREASERVSRQAQQAGAQQAAAAEQARWRAQSDLERREQLERQQRETDQRAREERERLATYQASVREVTRPRPPQVDAACVAERQRAYDEALPHVTMGDLGFAARAWNRYQCGDRLEPPLP